MGIIYKFSLVGVGERDVTRVGDTYNINCIDVLSFKMGNSYSVFFFVWIFHGNLHVSFLCTNNAMRIKKEALLKEENEYWNIIKRDNVLLSFLSRLLRYICWINEAWKAKKTKIIEKVNEMKAVMEEENLEPVMCGR